MDVGKREKRISAMILPKRKEKKRKLNCGKSNAMVTNYFTIFLQTVVMANFLLILIMA